MKPEGQEPKVNADRRSTGKMPQYYVRNAAQGINLLYDHLMFD
jgi:hypothetical protein